MTTNPYASPESQVLDISPADTAETSAPFFAVSTTKLVVLSFCTLGIYQLYWFYQNWRLIKRRTRENIMPVWRAIFGIFFCYSLFSRVRNHDPQSSAAKLDAGPLAAGWIVLGILARLPEPYWMITFLSVFVLLPVQGAINSINRQEAPDSDPNSRFSAWNWLAVVLGLPMLALMVYATLFIPTEQAL